MKTKLASSLLFASFATSAQPQNPEEFTLEDVTVTGSSIKANNTAKFTPIEVITSEDIKRSGARTVNDLLKYIPSIDFSDYESQNASGSANGSAFIRLRGLNANNTLVLLNGQRLPASPVQVNNGNGAAVDVNLIPFAAIERVEILKDSGSAVYGSDAVAGVVNFITKDYVKGINVFENFSETTHADGQQNQFGFSTGAGNLAKGRFSGLFVFEYLLRDPIYRADRSNTKTADYRGFDLGNGLFGPDTRSGYAPQGNLIGATGNFLGTERQCPPTNLHGNCRFDYNAYPAPALNAADRFNIFTNGNIKFGKTITMRNQFMYSGSSTLLQSQPVPGIFKLANGDVIAGRFLQGGYRNNLRDSSFYQLSSTLDGELFGQNWELASGYGSNTSNSNYDNYFYKSQLLKAFRTGLIDPTVTTNNQALIDALSASFQNQMTSELAFVNGKFSGDIWRNRTASLQYAGGFQYRHERLYDKPDALAQSKNILGSSSQVAFDHSRDVFSLFSELKLTPISELEIQAAARYDHYSNAENISPKVSISFAPNRMVNLHGNWGQSFLMPTLLQTSKLADSYNNTISGSDCLLIGKPISCTATATVLSPANPNLKPERATSWNIGFDFNPDSYLKSSFEYWEIAKSAEIYLPNLQMSLQNQLCRDIKNGYCTTGNDNLMIIYSYNTNLSSSTYRGVDGKMEVSIPLGVYGELTIRNQLTYYLQNTRKRSPTNLTENLLGYASQMPVWRNMASITWSTRNWSTTLIARSTAGFIDTFNFPTASQPVPGNTHRVDNYTEADLIVAYKGVKNLTLSGGFKNFTNAQPPFSAAAAIYYDGNANMPWYDNRGAYGFINANYHFDL